MLPRSHPIQQPKQPSRTENEAAVYTKKKAARHNSLTKKKTNSFSLNPTTAYSTRAPTENCRSTSDPQRKLLQFWSPHCYRTRPATAQKQQHSNRQVRKSRNKNLVRPRNNQKPPLHPARAEAISPYKTSDSNTVHKRNTAEFLSVP